MDYSSRISALPGENPQDPIEESWERCRNLGLDNNQTPGHGSCDPRELVALQRQHASLLKATEDEATPYFDNMLHNTQCMVVFADPGGTILKTLHPESQLPAMFEGIRPGSIWDEASAGTNAIGTSLATAQAVHVRGDQHYLKTHRHLTGSATPLFDANGDLAGSLCLCATTRMPGDYSLGMVKLLSHGIENRLIFQTYQADFHILKFNTSASSLDSSWAGLLVVDSDGTIRAANRRARTLLGESLATGNLRHLFDLDLADLTAAATATPMRLKARGNYQILAQVIPPKAIRPAHGARQDTTNIPEDVINPGRLEHGDNRVRRLVNQARKMMEKDIPLLVFGETGSGKEILVRSLHYHSSRAAGPLIAVNCAAIPSELAESQLFGYEKGAFTGAHNKGYVGLIRQADGGTLFLDEIGEMPLMLQSRLLRVLQQREVTPLGSTESYPVDIKLISATNRSLRDDISKGHFRQDLYYRIAGLNLELPALRDRTDRQALIRFVHQRLTGTEPGPALSDTMLNLLSRHPWPGNIRQLVHVLKVGLAMADGELLEEDHLPDDFFADSDEPVSIQTEPLDELLPRLYRANGGNVSRTARAAGVSRNTVYKYLRPLTAG
ncbi:sigma-54-dependent Fis family transcriptional regulator [Marinobacter sp. HL-58]|uniref:sigma-54-dependent Fis family transcriptional regulator n=1 Tax=Marinobacter sp. HL-58 TaxID=1479237 RepID=UPI00068C3266|nr:sigma-54-dependent Fis family transcriptional regulator [Marinobacter sp. HL-58]KPP99001.1 MAG: Transcriptional activator of acetoin/glycerol metabolism [Marinobacter sp. HL-58]